MENKTVSKDRFFSIELKSKAHLKNIAITNGSSESVLIEGILGKLEIARFAEGIILEVIGKNGVLRVDLGEDEITKPQLKVDVEVKQCQ
jgi:hypothetical protein